MHNKITSIEVVSTPALLRFLALVFAGGFLGQFAAIHAGLQHGGAPWLFLTMWTPAVAGLTASRSTRRAAIAMLKRSGGRWLALGLVVGWGPELLKAALLCLTGTGKWDSKHFELAPGGGSIQSIHQLGVVLGFGPQGFGYFALNLLLSLSLGSVMTGLFGGIGEELGWRGVLQPALEKRFGATWGTCTVGLIWAYWHLPVNLAGYNDPVHPVWTALLLFPLGITALSFALAWLTRVSRSVWPAALAHGANNAISTAFVIVARGWTADTLAELVGLLAVGAVFAWLSRSRNLSG